MSKPVIIPDLKYKSRKRRGRGTGPKGLRATLKYLTFREDRDERAKTWGDERWADCGLGQHHRAIFANCDRLKSEHVLAWTWVLSPAPDLMARVPETRRRDLVMDLTERVVEAYYDARGYQTPPYSYVLHDRLTADGEQQLHTHVILPGLAPTVAGWEPLYNNRSDGHDALFNDIARAECEQALGRTIGPDWRRLRDEPEIPQDIDSLDAWFPR